MYLIYDIDLVFSLIGFESGFFDQIPYILDTIVRRSIDLDTIEHIPIIERDTMSTDMTWIPILQVQTIDSLREYTSRRRLACPTRTGEDIGVTDSSLDE